MSGTMGGIDFGELYENLQGDSVGQLLNGCSACPLEGGYPAGLTSYQKVSNWSIFGVKRRKSSKFL